MPSEKTACKRCGTAILQITADLTEGYCMPCANDQVQANEPVSDYARRRNPEPMLNHLHPGDSIILSAAYFPGWTPDLTGWTIQVSRDGVVRQAVRWYPARTNEEELLKPITLNPSKLAEIQETIDLCPPGGFQALEQAACIDDAAMVSLVIPVKKIRIDLPYFDLAHDLKIGRLRFDEIQNSLFSLFGRIWGFADRHAPYSLGEHVKARRGPSYQKNG